LDNACSPLGFKGEHNTCRTGAAQSVKDQEKQGFT